MKLNSSSILHPVELYTIRGILEERITFILNSKQSKRFCGLVRPEDEGKTILRYLGNYLAYLLDDINTSTKKCI